MSAAGPMSLKLSDEEKQLIDRQARDEGVYPHGLVRSFVRYCLGLPVAPRVRESIAAANDRRETTAASR